MDMDVSGKIIGARLMLRVRQQFHIDVSRGSKWEEEVFNLMTARHSVTGYVRRKWWQRMIRPGWNGIPLGNRPPLLAVGCIHSFYCLRYLAMTAVSHYLKNTLQHHEGGKCSTVSRKQEPSCAEICHKIHQCEYCATDIQVSVRPDPVLKSKVPCILEVTTYKDLGPSEPHTSILWTSATNPVAQVLGRALELDYGVSSLQRVFEGGGSFDGVEPRLREWAGGGSVHRAVTPPWWSGYPSLQEWRAMTRPKQWMKIEKGECPPNAKPSYWWAF